MKAKDFDKGPVETVNFEQQIQQIQYVDMTRFTNSFNALAVED